MPVTNKSPFGAPLYSSGAAIAASVATLTALKALSEPADRITGVEVIVDADGSRWIYSATSTLTGDDLFVVTPTGSPAAGRWLRAPGVVDLKMPIAFGTADAAVLATLPAGSRLLVRRGYWEVTADFTGGSSSAIGLSASTTGATTKGDLHGGASGNVAAGLTAGTRAGTIGAQVAAGVLMSAGETIKFDRITSAFTAGSGFAHLVVELLLNPGA